MYQFNSLVISYIHTHTHIYYNFVILLVATLRITNNIFTYHSLIWVNTKFISVLYKNFAPIKLCPSLLCTVIVIQMTFLYIISPSTQFNNSFFMQFFSNLQEEKCYKNTFYGNVFIFVVSFTTALYCFIWICITAQCPVILI